MLQELIQLLPGDAGMMAMVVAGGGVVVGAALWLLGAKFSRPLLTLLTVALGGAVGMQLPHWLGWSISGAGPAVGCAVILGISGFILHRMWVGIGLGLVMAFWTTLVTWMLLRHGQSWTWPTPDADAGVWEYAKQVWSAVPPDVARILPLASCAALISGVASAILWPKLTTVVGWSTAGVTLIATTGLAAMKYGRPQSLEQIPSQSWVQVVSLLGMVLFGALMQWRVTGGGRRVESAIVTSKSPAPSAA
ncbi:MAG: hypothetical protein ACREJC_20705 [Tepidisphaeraceae bacterium]